MGGRKRGTDGRQREGTGQPPQLGGDGGLAEWSVIRIRKSGLDGRKYQALDLGIETLAHENDDGRLKDPVNFPSRLSG
ncbi:hypothetical protein Nepgr_006093 [Nepenthes gracilis]|uniref:Uncharacterized protein n=1 Tax=Nepenthes gracilis TaxID=150966 RepID=A0AAD3S4R8_NEPGR|nr:hypothetical protein Nepgr_006093 [Nepenthes gracilis]